MNITERPEYADVFTALRPRLLRLAYRMIGSVADSEDIVQDAWMRWAKQSFPDLDNPVAYFTTVTTRLCLDYLKSSKTRREHYVGMWLPEPVVEDCELMATTDALDEKLDVSYAIMMVLEKLTPLERAAYLLHDLFDISFDEIARVIERTPASCRKLASRARKQLETREKRYQPDHTVIANLLAAFFESQQSGNPARLIEHLAHDIKYHADGGGKIPAALNTIFGVKNVANLLLSLAKKSATIPNIELGRVNGQIAILLRDETGLTQPICLDLNDQGKIATIYTVRNPDKLAMLNRS